MRTKSPLPTLALSFFLLAGCLAPSKPPKPGSIEAMAAASDVVLVGKVLAGESQWRDRKIFTTWEIAPLRTMKGTAPSKSVQVVTLGGRVSPIVQRVTHQATPVIGEVAVFFLAQLDSHPELGDLRIVSEEGRIALIGPQQPESRLQNNRRLRRFLDDLDERIPE